MANYQSEYSGRTRTNTIAAKKKTDDLSPSEEMRLMKITGTSDVTEDPDFVRSWNGLEKSPKSVVDFSD